MMNRTALPSSILICAALLLRPSDSSFINAHIEKPVAFVCSSTLPRGQRCLGAFNMFTPGNNEDERLATASAEGDKKNAETEEKTGTWNPFSLAVLKLGFTEPAYTSPFNYNKSPGIYKCANCRSPLFSSNAKYDSGSGWPSFWKTVDSDRVSIKREWDGRTECVCANCGGHLGHVFPDGPTRSSLDEIELRTVPETDPKIGYKVKQSAADGGEGESKYSRMPRFCVNGMALRFEKNDE